MRVPPVPIPNTAVKPHRAESTWRATAWQDRSSPGFFYARTSFMQKCWRFLVLVGRKLRKVEGGTCNVGERMFFRGAYLSVLSLRAGIRLGSNFLFFLAFGFLK